MMLINIGIEKIGTFEVKYSLYQKNFEGHKLYDVIVDDILVGDISVKDDLNNCFNTYKSSFCRTLQYAIQKKENIYLNITGGLNGYYE